MPTSNMTTWYHCNTYNADAACEHCSGVIRQEDWCIRRNDAVSYAYEALLDADELSLGDRIILHALGVVWRGKVYDGRCQALAAATSG